MQAIALLGVAMLIAFVVALGVLFVGDKGKMLCDGAGGASLVGDLAVDGAHIAALGGEVGPGREEIDARELPPGLREPDNFLAFRSYSPEHTLAVKATNKLLNVDNIFLMVGAMGTPMNIALMPRMFEGRRVSCSSAARSMRSSSAVAVAHRAPSASITAVIFLYIIIIFITWF